MAMKRIWFGLCKGEAYKGIIVFGLYIGWQFNAPLRRLWLRFFHCGTRGDRHIWIGPVYIKTAKCVKVS